MKSSVPLPHLEITQEGPDYQKVPWQLIPGTGNLPAPTAQADGLLQMAIQQGMPVESLKELVALRNDELKRLAKGAFVRAMAKFQAEVPIITKNKEVSFGEGRSKVSYKHAQLWKIADTVKGTLQDCGLSYRWEIKDKQEGATASLITVDFILTHVEGHSETTSMSAGLDNSGSKNLIQQRGSTITYLQRYTMIGGLGLTTADEDNDGGGQDEEVETISEEQYTELHALLTDNGVGSDKIGEWLNRAAKASGAASIKELPADKFQEVKAKLQAGITEAKNRASRTAK